MTLLTNQLIILNQSETVHIGKLHTIGPWLSNISSLLSARIKMLFLVLIETYPFCTIWISQYRYYNLL